MASINEEACIVCGKCEEELVLTNFDKLRLSGVKLTREQLILENLRLQIAVSKLENQLAEKPTTRIKIIPGQDG